MDNCKKGTWDSKGHGGGCGITGLEHRFLRCIGKSGGCYHSLRRHVGSGSWWSGTPGNSSCGRLAL